MVSVVCALACWMMEKAGSSEVVTRSNVSKVARSEWCVFMVYLNLKLVFIRGVYI